MVSMSAPVEVTVILGVTASGKSAVAMELAPAVRGEILSVDSMQVYRGMDIGTAKPSADEQARVRHHLIDVVAPREPFTVARYLELADAAMADMHARGATILAVGGTALYLKALTEGLFEGPDPDPALRRELAARADSEGTAALHAELADSDPAAAARIHPNDLRRIVRALEVHAQTGRPISELQSQFGSPRPGYAFRFIGIRRPREVESRRINARVRQMIDAGLVEETRSLLAAPGGLSEQARQALGYAQVIEHLAGRCTLDEAVEQIKIQTRRFAKHQRTWFRRFGRVHWIEMGEDHDPADAAAEALAAMQQPPDASGADR
ncbi:MAG: tRNA dimethylallyltransferase [Phycisphaerae bacterium]|nr:tRNA dimethylallyltransferase [Phycisphaerae bacterium]